MKVTNFNKANLPQIRKELGELLEAYGKTVGLEFDIGKIRFMDKEFTGELKVKVAGAATVADKMLESQMKSLGLAKNGLGGRVLVGYNRSAYKMPFQYEQGGKRFKCDATMAKAYFGGQA